MDTLRTILGLVIFALAPVSCAKLMFDIDSATEAQKTAQRSEALATAKIWRDRCAKNKDGMIGHYDGALPGQRIVLAFSWDSRGVYRIADIEHVECNQAAIDAVMPWKNSCVENLAGSVGVVAKEEYAEVRVAFKSGLVERYSKDELKRIECPAHIVTR